MAGDDLPERRPPDGRDGLDERQVRQLALIGALVLVVSILLIFVIENSDEVRVSFVFFSADVSLIWVIVMSAVVGAVAGGVVGRLVRRRFSKD
ncbi:lipopolysaccharide assembly protein LapA domain-containing protein [Miltoncostaea marina]|uniref:lipopolysaccharide assembly protein LapA domain-containing protein n=1 Tax=Miltoncostaea marina TaxID=2843215 RepID=UPI001C3D95A5|nr:lipopolysaccharide assembly protein LapA domain-containing protein [Miltoncostaea marina]